VEEKVKSKVGPACGKKEATVSTHIASPSFVITCTCPFFDNSSMWEKGMKRIGSASLGMVVAAWYAIVATSGYV